MTSKINITSIVILLLSVALACGCKQSSKEKVAADSSKVSVYKEKHRPQFHFTPQANWMNDPNGMFYFEGKYHLFYQYFPDSTVWGPMHWGHAESSDMIHWDHLPIALFPDSIGCIFSGGAIVDNKNTSGFGTDQVPPIIATFTHHDFVGEKAKTNDFQKQSLAYSTDGGVHWEKYKGNPVIPNKEKIKDFRDPKVVWHEATQKWILVLAAYDRVKFYASPNLIDWQFLSDFAIEGDSRLWECPDLFQMKVEGSNEIKWVLIVSIQKEAPNGGTATSYFVGEFDGKKFAADRAKQKWLDWGTDNYAFVTWNNVPADDNRVLGIGWMSNWQYAQVVPTEKWRSAMTLPRELTLLKVENDYQIFSLPVAEFSVLRGQPTLIEKKVVSEKTMLPVSFSPSQAEYDFRIDLDESTASSFDIEFENSAGESYLVGFNRKDGKMYVDRTQSGKQDFSKEFYKDLHHAPINFNKSELHIRLIMDVASVEIFIDNGAVSFTSIFFPSEKYDKVSLSAADGNLLLSESRIYPLNSIE